MILFCISKHGRAVYLNTSHYINVQGQGGFTTEETVAQAICHSAVLEEGYSSFWTYAVGRLCQWPTHTDTCTSICQSANLHVQDAQTVHGKWECITGIHVYSGRKATFTNGDTKTATLGLKTYQDNCDQPTCGPNFCCCAVINF